VHKRPQICSETRVLPSHDGGPIHLNAAFDHDHLRASHGSRLSARPRAHLLPEATDERCTFVLLSATSIQSALSAVAGRDGGLLIAKPVPLVARVTITAIFFEAIYVSSCTAIGGKVPGPLTFVGRQVVLCVGHPRAQDSSVGRDRRATDPPFIAGQLTQSAWARSPAGA
jgi:hypothetical protein